MVWIFEVISNAIFRKTNFQRLVNFSDVVLFWSVVSTSVCIFEHILHRRVSRTRIDEKSIQYVLVLNIFFDLEIIFWSLNLYISGLQAYIVFGTFPKFWKIFLFESF